MININKDGNLLLRFQQTPLKDYRIDLNVNTLI